MDLELDTANTIYDSEANELTLNFTGSDPLMSSGVDYMMLASRFTVSDMAGGYGALTIAIDSVSIADGGLSVCLYLNESDLSALAVAGQTLYVNYEDSAGGDGILETESGSEIGPFESSVWAMPPSEDGSGGTQVEDASGGQGSSNVHQMLNPLMVLVQTGN